MAKKLTERQMNETVTVTCYRKKEKMTRRAAIDYYQEGMACCDPGSSEFERYATIYMQLTLGFMDCSDEC